MILKYCKYCRDVLNGGGSARKYCDIRCLYDWRNENRKRHRYLVSCEICGTLYKSSLKTGRRCKEHRYIGVPKKFVLSDTEWFELLVESNNASTVASEKAAYAAMKVGCSSGTIWDKAKQLGYRWSIPTSRRAATTTMRKLVIDKCSLCEEARVLELAHLIADCDGGTATFDNLVVLCPTHHKLFDTGLLNQQESEDMEHICAGKFSSLHRSIAI